MPGQDYVESILGPPPPRPTAEMLANPEANREALHAWRQYELDSEKVIEDSFKGGADLSDMGYQDAKGKGQKWYNMYGPNGAYSAYGGGVSTGNWQYDWLHGRKRKQRGIGLDESEGWIPVTANEQQSFNEQQRWNARNPGMSYRDRLGKQGLRGQVRAGNLIPGPDGLFYDPAVGGVTAANVMQMYQQNPGNFRGVYDRYNRRVSGQGGYTAGGRWTPFTGQFAGSPPGALRRPPAGGGDSTIDPATGQPYSMPTEDGGGGGNMPPTAPGGGPNDPGQDKAILWPDFSGQEKTSMFSGRRLFDSQNGGATPPGQAPPDIDFGNFNYQEPNYITGRMGDPYQKAILWPDFMAKSGRMNRPTTASTPAPTPTSGDPNWLARRQQGSIFDSFPELLNTVMGPLPPQLSTYGAQGPNNASLFPSGGPASSGQQVSSSNDMPSVWANFSRGGNGFTGAPGGSFDPNRFDAFSTYSKMFPTQNSGGSGSNSMQPFKNFFGKAWNGNMWGGAQ